MTAKQKTPICPACGKKAARVKGDIFTCHECGGAWIVDGYTEKATKNRHCLVCNEIVETGEPVDISGYRYSSGTKAYICDKCRKIFLSNNELDNKQFEEETARYGVVMSTPCEKCGDTETIMMLPWGDTTGKWICTSCDTEYSDEWVNKILSSCGFKPLACLRCGEIYEMSQGHDCQLAPQYKGGAL